MAKKKRSKFGDKVHSDVQRQKNRRSQFGYLELPEGVEQFKEEPTTKENPYVKLDILPYKVTNRHHLDRDEERENALTGDLWYKCPIKVHHNIGSGDTQRTVICPSTIGKKCPICEYRNERRDSKNADKKEIEALNWSYRNLYIVIPIDHDDYKEKIHIWDIAQGNFQKLLNEEIDMEEDIRGFPDLEDGLTLYIRFSSETFNKNEYAKASKIKFKEREEAYSEDILEDIPKLDDCLRILSYEELKNLLLGIEEEDNDEPEEEEPDKKMKRKPKEEPEPDDDDEEDLEQEDKKEKKKSEKNKCPEGFRWGLDCEKHKDCVECDLWEECTEAKQEMID